MFEDNDEEIYSVDSSHHDILREFLNPHRNSFIRRNRMKSTFDYPNVPSQESMIDKQSSNSFSEIPFRP